MLEIPLTRGMITQVSDEDADLAEHSWHALQCSTVYYAARTIKLGPGTRENPNRALELLHNCIGARMGLIGRADHKDRNSMNNQRYNLREATHQENMRNKGLKADNTTGYKGVHYRAEKQKYQAYITLTRKEKIHLGYFDTAEEAARAYDRVALRFFKEFAVLNFP